MHWFERHMNADGLVGFIPWWVFVDWCPAEWPDGMPPEVHTGASTVVNLMYIVALESGARLYRAVGDHHHADVWTRRAARMREAVRAAAWDDAQGLFVDGPGSRNLSQHTNLWAILAGAATADQAARILERLTDDPTLVKTSYIHDYYLFQALLKVGEVERLDGIMDRWRAMVDYGFSTFPEQAEPSRSDCHAWSAWPMVEFLRTLLGVRPLEPGYERALIAPRPFGSLTRACGVVPTCRGPIAAAWRREGDRFALKVRLPDGVPAEVRLPDGTVRQLEAGGEAALGDAALAGEIDLDRADVKLEKMGN
jgi:hypothetical protein